MIENGITDDGDAGNNERRNIKHAARQHCVRVSGRRLETNTTPLNSTITLFYYLHSTKWKPEKQQHQSRTADIGLSNCRIGPLSSVGMSEKPQDTAGHHRTPNGNFPYDMKRFCQKDTPVTLRYVIGIDRTFNLGPCFVTTLVYKNKSVVQALK